MSWFLFLSTMWPKVSLVLGLAVGVQRVVNGRLPFQQFVVVLVDEPKSLGNSL